MTRLRVGVVGVGHLGKEHARILSGMPDITLVGVADPNMNQAEAVALRCGTQAFSEHRPLLDCVDAAVIAAPTAYHHGISCDFLRRGISLLVEKPLTAELDPADELVTLATQNRALLQVGHVERFNPAFVEFRRHALQPKYITCERCSGFSGRSTDVGVVLDLMIHDLDLVLSLTRSPIASVWAMGVAVLGGHEDVARARLTFADGCVADLSASRVSPAPARRMQVWGPEGYAAIDFSARHLRLVQPSDTLRQGRIDSRRLDAATVGSLRAELYPRYLQSLEIECAGGDQLTAELQEFLTCVQDKRAPRVDGNAGRDAVAAATQILDRIRDHAWNGNAAGAVGPQQMPAIAGKLFVAPAREAAA
jgi:predicted dehydrogenase